MSEPWLSLLTPEEREAISEAARDGLHGDDPRMLVLEDLARRGVGRLVYHFGWSLETAGASRG